MPRIAEVHSVGLALTKSLPPQVIVTTNGTVATPGWSDEQLAPWYYVTPPEDRILDLDFLAVPPPGRPSSEPTALAAHLLIDRDPLTFWGEEMPLAGVRVHSASNSIVGEFDANRTVDTPVRTSVSGGELDPWPWNLDVARGGEGIPWPWSVVAAGGGDSNPWPWKIRSPFTSGGDVQPWPWQNADPGALLKALTGKKINPYLSPLVLLGKTLRVYKTGDMLTTGFDPERANIEIDPAGGRILDVWIG